MANNIKTLLYITPAEAALIESGSSITVGGVTISLANIEDYDVRVKYEEKWVPGTGIGSLVTKDNVGGSAAGDYAIAEGWGTDANAKYSHVEGQLTSSIDGADCSHAEGQSTVAGAPCTHVEGMNTVSNNTAEHAQGQWNKSHKASDTFGNAGNTTDSIGIGTSLENAKNAEETMQNGDKYIIGVGGYDGTNPDEASTVQEELDKIKNVQSFHFTFIDGSTATYKLPVTEVS